LTHDSTSRTPRYKINSPTVIFEAFDDESVIIHFTTGNYYSIDATGNEIWKSAVAGASGDAITAELTKKYSAEYDLIRKSVMQFIDELVKENLIIPDMSNSDVVTLAAGDDRSPSVRPVFTPPVLNKYSDMQGLLVLDPIHEVDDTGWPNAKPKSTQ
jgi:hypothetical protein